MEMVDTSFETMEMAFVYGVVTLALAASAPGSGSERSHGPVEGVSSMLGQAGYEVVVVEGRKRQEPHRWLEVGRPGEAPELIVDLSAPDSSHDTVLPKCPPRKM